MLFFLLIFLVTSVILLQVVSQAAGQGVSIEGNDTFNYWNWPNAVIFAATVITTIGEYSSCSASLDILLHESHVRNQFLLLLSAKASG